MSYALLVVNVASFQDSALLNVRWRYRVKGLARLTWTFASLRSGVLRARSASDVFAKPLSLRERGLR